MSDETRELHRIISASVRDMPDAYRLQASAGPVTDKALEEMVFRGAQPVMHTVSRRSPPSSGSRCYRTSCACCWRPSSKPWHERTARRRCDDLPDAVRDGVQGAGDGAARMIERHILEAMIGNMTCVS